MNQILKKGITIPYPNMDGIKEAVMELSSLSCIHYFAQSAESKGDKSSRYEEEEESVKQEEEEVLKKKDDKENKDTLGRINVCSTHKDTGLLTFILCSKDKQPGLQIQNKKNKEWLDVEQLVQYPNGCDHVLFVIIGEKLFAFASAAQGFWDATVHRVLIPPQVERTSILFFMDVSP